MTLVELKKWSERVLWQVFTLAGHSDGVTSVDFPPDGKHCVSGSIDKLVKIWNTETGAEVSSFVGLREVRGNDGSFGSSRYLQNLPLKTSEIMWVGHRCTR